MIIYDGIIVWETTCGERIIFTVFLVSADIGSVDTLRLSTVEEKIPLNR